MVLIEIIEKFHEKKLLFFNVYEKRKNMKPDSFIKVQKTFSDIFFIFFQQEYHSIYIIARNTPCICRVASYTFMYIESSYNTHILLILIFDEINSI